MPVIETNFPTFGSDLGPYYHTHSKTLLNNQLPYHTPFSSVDKVFFFTRSCNIAPKVLSNFYNQWFTYGWITVFFRRSNPPCLSDLKHWGRDTQQKAEEGVQDAQAKIKEKLSIGTYIPAPNCTLNCTIIINWRQWVPIVCPKSILCQNMPKSELVTTWRIRSRIRNLLSTISLSLSERHS